MASKRTARSVSPLHGIWLIVFVIDASLSGRGREHQLGALALLLLFAILIVTELRSRQPVDK